VIAHDPARHRLREGAGRRAQLLEDAVQSRDPGARQPGSLFKPFVYVAAMDPARGQQALTAATVLDDSPISVRSGNAVWRRRTTTSASTAMSPCARRWRIRTTSRRCARRSTPACRTWSRTASTIGIQSRASSRIRRSSLGSFEVTPLEIAYAYSAFANLGVKAEPISILAVATRDGKLLESREVKMKRVAPAASAT
jgi:membrane carboxypeptidase/penicillin-binding protein